MNFIRRIIKAWKAYNVHRKWSPRFMKYCPYCKHSMKYRHSLGYECTLLFYDCHKLNPKYDCEYYEGVK